MTDTYTQLVNNPIGVVHRRQRRPAEAGRARPLRPRRAPLIDGRVLIGSARGRPPRSGVAEVLAGANASVDSRLDDRGHGDALDRVMIDAGVWNPEAPGEQPLEGARLRRVRHRRSSAELRELWAFFHPTIRRICSRPAALIVLGTPPEDCADPSCGDRPACARGVRPRGRQGGSRRRDRPAPLRRARRRGPARLEPALLPLAALGLRLRPGREDRRRPATFPTSTSAHPAARQGRARHRRLPRDRRVDRPGARSRRRARRRPRRSRPEGRPRAGDRRDRRIDDHRRHHRRRGAGDDLRRARRRSRRRRHRRPQRRRHPRQDARRHGRGAMGRC